MTRVELNNISNLSHPLIMFNLPQLNITILNTVTQHNTTRTIVVIHNVDNDINLFDGYHTEQNIQ
jgi:hypothetical protein